MRALLAVILSTLSSLSFAQIKTAGKKPAEIAKPLNRLVYEQYFKALYQYEPSVIRENRIAYLEVKSNQKRGDSLVYSRVKQKARFREDGRPIKVVEWNEYYQDSMITDYSYDSLGNMTAYRSWMPRRYIYGKQVVWEMSHIFFHYNGRRLTKVFSYSMHHERDYSTLSFCDSLSYNMNDQKVFIFRGNANDSAVAYTPALKFIYPVRTNHIIQHTFNEKEILNKPYDKEILWGKTDCVYQNSILRELQRRTGIQCFNDVIINTFKGAGRLHEGSMSNSETLTLTPDVKRFSTTENAVFVDTLTSIIHIKAQFTRIQPTSLEDLVINTQSIQSYDYSLRLLEHETILQRSRGQRESRKDSIQTSYTYFDFGLLQRKLELRYLIPTAQILSATGPAIKQKERYDVVTLEEETTIKTWE